MQVEAREWWRPAVDRRGWTTAPGSRVPFVGLLAFTFILMLAPQNVFPALAPLRVAMIAGGLAIGSHLLDRFAQGRPLLRTSPEMALATCLFLWALAVAPLSYWPGGSLSLLLDLFLKSFCLFWLIANVVTTRRRLRVMCWTLVLLTLPLTITAGRNYVSGAFIPGAPIQRVLGYDAPLTRNPNDLALLLNLILPLSIAFVLCEKRPGLRALAGLAASLQVAGVVLTFSRAGFLTLGATGLAYLFRLARRGDWGYVAAALAVAGLMLPMLPAGYGERLATIADVDADPTRSAQQRWRDLSAAASFVLDHPVFGAGAGMDILALNEVRGPGWVSVHNVYLQHAVDLGVPGLTLFVLLLAACVANTARLLRAFAARGEHGTLFHLGEAIGISLVTFAVAGLFHPVAYRFYFFYLAGLAGALRAIDEEDGTVLRREGLRRSGASPLREALGLPPDAPLARRATHPFEGTGVERGNQAPR